MWEKKKGRTINDVSFYLKNQKKIKKRTITEREANLRKVEKSNNINIKVQVNEMETTDLKVGLTSARKIQEKEKSQFTSIRNFLKRDISIVLSI